MRWSIYVDPETASVLPAAIVGGLVLLALVGRFGRGVTILVGLSILVIYLSACGPDPEGIVRVDLDTDTCEARGGYVVTEQIEGHTTLVCEVTR